MLNNNTQLIEDSKRLRKKYQINNNLDQKNVYQNIISSRDTKKQLKNIGQVILNLNNISISPNYSKFDSSQRQTIIHQRTEGTKI